MKTNENYESFVLRTCRQQRTARTLHDAYRDGEYGYTIHLFKDDVQRAKEFMIEFLVGMAVMGTGLAMVYGFLVWLGVV